MAETNTNKPKVLEKDVVSFVPHPTKPDTKNTYRFEEVLRAKKPKIIGQLYVQKTAFKTKPDLLRVTVEVLEA